MNNIIDFTVMYVYKEYPKKYNFTNVRQKHNLYDIVKELLYMLESAIQWRKYRGPIKWYTLYKHHLFFASNNIFKKVYQPTDKRLLSFFIYGYRYIHFLT